MAFMIASMISKSVDFGQNILALIVEEIFKKSRELAKSKSIFEIG